MVTVPANKLIAGLPTDRMPAFLEWGDFPKWIGKQPASVDELKAMLKTVEGVRWRMTPETAHRQTAPQTHGRRSGRSVPEIILHGQMDRRRRCGSRALMALEIVPHEKADYADRDQNRAQQKGQNGVGTAISRD